MKRTIPVAVFSLEMSKEQLVLRLLCSQSEVRLHKVRTRLPERRRTGRGSPTARRPAHRGADLHRRLAGLTVLEIRAKCRRLVAEDTLGLIVVDYLQLIRGARHAENRVQEISQITRSLKALAKELDVPVIALSQLSRAVEPRGGTERPQLSDLRESGAIEQDADVVMFVYREEYYKPDDPSSCDGKAEIIVAKQRNGPTGTSSSTFLREFTKFECPAAPMSGAEASPSAWTETAHRNARRSAPRSTRCVRRRSVASSAVAEVGRVAHAPRRHPPRRHPRRLRSFGLVVQQMGAIGVGSLRLVSHRRPVHRRGRRGPGRLPVLERRAAQALPRRGHPALGDHRAGPGAHGARRRRARRRARSRPSSAP